MHEQPCTSRTLRPGGGKHAFMASHSGISYSVIFKSLQVIFKAGSSLSPPSLFSPLSPPQQYSESDSLQPLSSLCALVSHSRARRAAELSTAGMDGGCPCPSSGQREFLKGPRVQKGVTVATPQTHDLSTLPRPVAGN